MNVTAVPEGLLRVKLRSPTQVCDISTETFTSIMLPLIPLTGRVEVMLATPTGKLIGPPELLYVVHMGPVDVLVAVGKAVNVAVGGTLVFVAVGGIGVLVGGMLVLVAVGRGVLVAVGKAVNVAVGGTLVLVAVGGTGVLVGGMLVLVAVGRGVLVVVGKGVTVGFVPPIVNRPSPSIAR